MPDIRVVACLGNPGKKYFLTWHNAGFWVADVLAREAGVAFSDAGMFLVTELPCGTSVIKPTTFMNRSGSSVRAFLDGTGHDPSSILVVCDDVNLDLGRLRLRSRGSDGGHNGLDDIISKLGTEEFTRLRVGIGPAPEGTDLAEFVLDRIPARLEEEASLAAHRAADCVMLAVNSGIQSAQEIYNRRSEGD